MKLFFKILVAIVLLLIASVISYFSIGRSINCIDYSNVKGVDLYKDHQHNFADFKSAEQINEFQAQLREWWGHSDYGWKPTFVTYIPGFIVSTDKGNLNILNNIAIINCSDGQFARELSDSEVLFFDKLKASIQNWTPK